ncbi:hypothetical protein BJ322DRAFT_1103529 [Thelephora terrestris]|uniref:Uncharacterized protein n=1 Tax=Thelephora terrestris TaxID=56493 RepID=A0A9P6LCX3_9AGAM|nr:hypothetical protein BJ322DRAFT_1103529 [Thelephora terrestris]
MTPTSSPAPLDARFVLSNRSTPVTPTPRRVRDAGDVMRSPISAQEFSAKKVSRDDSIFKEYRACLKRATTLTTFEWDAENLKGVLVPIPYPLYETGDPVEPLDLPVFLETHHWDRPSCFCAMRGSPRKTQLLTPTWRESLSHGMMCLVCSESECSYFVNVSELLEKYKAQVLSVKDADATEGDTETSGGDILAEAAPKRRKRDLRAGRPKAKGTVASHGIGSSSSHPRPNDHPSVGIASTISNLLGRHGVLQEQFHSEFRVCDYCRRIVCNETSRIDGHICIIEVED